MGFVIGKFLFLFIGMIMFWCNNLFNWWCNIFCFLGGSLYGLWCLEIVFGLRWIVCWIIFVILILGFLVVIK